MIDQWALPPASRRFRLIDLTVIVAASAFSFWFYRVCVGSQMRSGLPLTHTILYRSFVRGTLLHWIDWSFAIGFAVATPVGVALLILGLFPPRLRLRERFREPGLLACLLASLMIGRALVDAEFGSLAPYYQWSTYRFLQCSMEYTLPELAWTGDLAPTAVSVCWFTLWIADAWRPPSDWVEKAARVVGVYWLLAWIFHSFPQFLDLCFRFGQVPAP